MNKWHQPDSTWKVWGIDTFEKYVDAFVIEGRFHKGVHEDIIKSYELVEYLMAHSYYNYSMYDSVVQELSKITEMAIKIRTEQLKIKQTIIDKNGNKRDKTLSRLINELTQREAYKYLKRNLDLGRSLRNSFSHKKRFAVGGGIFKQMVLPAITTINRLFLSEELTFKTIEKIDSINDKIKAFKEGLHILNFNDQRYLVTQIFIHEAFLMKGEWVYVCCFLPITTNTFQNLSEKLLYHDPFTLPIKDITTFDTIFTALDIVFSQTIKLEKTSKPENLKVFEQFNLDLEKLNQVDLYRYHQHTNHLRAVKTTEYLYNFAWVE